MNIIATIKIAANALGINKMRSGLTMLGIIIGVAAVIAMLSVGSGARTQISKEIASLGSNLLIILPGAPTSGGLRMGFGTAPTLTSDDAKAIPQEISNVAFAAPILGGTAQIVYGNQNWSTIVTGTTPGFFDIREWQLDSGALFTQKDVDGATKVALVGQTVTENLFGYEDPLGKIIRIKKIPFRVIGVLSRKGQSPIGQDQDDSIYIPVTTAQKRLFGTTFPGMVRMITVKAKTSDAIKDAEKEIAALLRQRHHITAGRDEDDFSVRNLSEMMAASEQAAKIMSILLGSIASVSLIVGGIGIMNIMLVSVTERTREIGIRMAVGARPRDILMQFLIEAIVLAVIGGSIGILCGAGGSWLISYFAGWEIAISSVAIVLAFGFSALVGIFFGFYPARKASRLAPVECLRYE
ncbi:MAG: multidrug ABC transporter substrate-binding protein [Deltaproteobacteria bacterium RIFCSPLOWO2_12_FULL_43_16]|nr:MAG: multidrug ABC transporter substrate-binding protein [Deltaproteobacteria bacterium GWA2_43_19]OGQ57163.1 MAG: multidrug ABC transporter substrate-binding protein [Deltaproteobacteria bacterium RIFCSPLOWO2_12_FULL_43_16]HBR17953.1 multidrug ABC transporter substrate-binding protein [Deltaproteobacteria bacterium]